VLREERERREEPELGLQGCCVWREEENFRTGAMEEVCEQTGGQVEILEERIQGVA